MMRRSASIDRSAPIICPTVDRFIASAKHADAKPTRMPAYRATSPEGKILRTNRPQIVCTDISISKIEGWVGTSGAFKGKEGAITGSSPRDLESRAGVDHAGRRSR